MYRHTVGPDLLWDVLARIDRDFGRQGCLYLIGESSQVVEGWRDWTTQVEFFADVDPPDRPRLLEAVAHAGRATGVRILEEFPGDLIPLPDGYEARARDLSDPARAAHLGLTVRHFDPYSVAYRFIARGDEPDYHIVLVYLESGWITFDELTRRLDALLPRFSMETIAQDPAEFRRKFRGLRQMWRAVRARTTHRPTTA